MANIAGTNASAGAKRDLSPPQSDETSDDKANETSTEALARSPTTTERLSSANGTTDRLTGYSDNSVAANEDTSTSSDTDPKSTDGSSSANAAELQTKADSLDYTITALGTGGGYVTKALQAELLSTESSISALEGSSGIRGANEKSNSTTIDSTITANIEVDDVDYHLGVGPKPDISHDNGFLQNPADPNDPVPIPLRSPSLGERAYHAKEKILAGGGNIVSAIPGAGLVTDNADLDEGIDGYRHFLGGSGDTYTVDYSKYLSDDPSGIAIQSSVKADVRSAGDQFFAGLVESGEVVPDDIAPGESVTFTVSSAAVPVNEDFISDPNARYPYPQSENWQKAIGAHHIWTTNEITVTRQDDGSLVANADITVNFEDRYNFNPGQSDIATGVPDERRGRLEQSGLAKQFDQIGESELTSQWTIGSPDTPIVSVENDTSR